MVAHVCLVLATSYFSFRFSSLPVVTSFLETMKALLGTSSSDFSYMKLPRFDGSPALCVDIDRSQTVAHVNCGYG